MQGRSGGAQVFGGAENSNSRQVVQSQIMGLRLELPRPASTSQNPCPRTPNYTLARKDYIQKILFSEFISQKITFS